MKARWVRRKKTARVPKSRLIRRLAPAGRQASRTPGRVSLAARFNSCGVRFEWQSVMAGRAPEADDALGRLAEWVRPKLGLVGQSCQEVR